MTTQEGEGTRLTNARYEDRVDQAPAPWLITVTLEARGDAGRMVLGLYAQPGVLLHGRTELALAHGDGVAAVTARLPELLGALLATRSTVPKPPPALKPLPAEKARAGLTAAEALTPVSTRKPWAGTVTWVAGFGLVADEAVWLGLDAGMEPVVFAGRRGVLYRQPLTSLSWSTKSPLRIGWTESPLAGPGEGALVVEDKAFQLRCGSAPIPSQRLQAPPPPAESLQEVVFARKPVFSTTDATGTLYFVDQDHSDSLPVHYRVWIGRDGTYGAVDAGYGMMTDQRAAFFTPLGTLVVEGTRDHAARWVTPAGAVPLRTMTRGDALRAIWGKGGPYAAHPPATACLQATVLAMEQSVGAR